MPLIWFALIVGSLLMYIILDGYDLGIGVANLLERNGRHRAVMLEQVAVAWDGNETWLVLLGVSLWAGFPAAFGTILPHAYLAMIVMLFSLIVRGAAVEMASQRPPAPRWEKAFGLASLTAALAQGAVISTLAARLAVTGGAFNGPAFGAFGWFTALASVTVTCGYLALGYAHAVWKTTGDLRDKARRRGRAATMAAALLGTASLLALTTTAAPLNLTSPARAAGFAGLLVFAAAGLAVALAELRPAARSDVLPLAGLVTATVAGLLAVVVARYPVLAPPGLTVPGSAAPGGTMAFLAAGIGLNVPLILYYTWFAHHAFRGKQATTSGRPAHPGTRLGATDDH